MEVIHITLKSFLQIIGLLLAIKATVLFVYLLWGMQIIISGIVLPQWVIIADVIADAVLAYFALNYTKKKSKSSDRMERSL